MSITTRGIPTTVSEQATKAPEVSLLERLKRVMKKDTSLLEYIPLNDIVMTTQTDVPDTVPQTCELGTILGKDGSRLTLVACIGTKGRPNKTDSGIPRIHFFGHGPDGMSARQPFTACEVSRQNSINAAFAPSNTNLENLNVLLKYVFMAKGAPMPTDVKFLPGFTRSLRQVCRAYKEVAAKKAKAGEEETLAVSGTASSEQTAKTLQTESIHGDTNEDMEMLDGVPELEYDQPPSGFEFSDGNTNTTLSTSSYQASDDGSDLDFFLSNSDASHDTAVASFSSKSQEATGLTDGIQNYRLKQDEIDQQLAIQLQTGEKVDRGISKNQKITPLKHPWAMVEYQSSNERISKRQKISLEEEEEEEEDEVNMEE